MSVPSIDHRDLIPNDPAMIVEIVRQAEERFKMQVQIALAADARAGATTTWQSAAAAALIVAAMANLDGPAQAGALGAGFTLALGAFCGFYSMRPIAFGCIGTLPSGWLDVVKTNEPLVESLAGYAVILDEHLQANEARMSENANWLRGAFLAGLLSPVVGAISAMIGG